MTSPWVSFVSARRRRSPRFVATIGLALLSACGSDLRTAPHASKSIAIESGDRQTGSATAPLRQPLVVRVLDENGDAVSGATVRWTTRDGGALSPGESGTDERGFARSIWTLGASVGRQHAHAVVDGSAVADFTADAAVESGPMLAPLSLALATPDGSGQTVHPDFVAMPSEWSAAHQYLLMTPYPNGNATYENPSIFAQSAPSIWTPPAGVTNPIATPRHGYLSDPDAVAVPELNELWVYYRQVEARNEIYVIRSTDGVTFSTPRLVASAANHDIVSPSVVRRAPTDWMMWSVKSGGGCGAASTSLELRRSSNGLDWSPPEKVSLAQGGGISPWHVDVQWIASRHEFWAVFNGKTPGSCTTAALFLATSPDGVTWKTFSSPILTRGASRELADVVYRSTFAYDDRTDVIDFWYSGARYETGTYIWHTAYQRRPRGEVFATAAKKSVAAMAAIAPRFGIPPLMDPP
jgi:hypothetical protein